MDWLRRNWPDLLIGIALVAVIAGIIATLITGGSFFPVGQSTRTSTPTQNSTTQSVAPQAPSTPSTSSNSSSTSGNGSNSGAGTASQATSSGSSGSSGASSQNGTSATAPSNGGVSVLPPSGSSSSNGSSSASAGTSSSAAPATATAGNGSASTASTSSPSSSSSQPATASTGPGSAAPYRISVGAFSHKDYAQRQEAVFKKAGYPVFLASQGDLTIVLVGPYKSQSEAEQVAGKIKNGGYGVDPVVYQFQGTSDQAPAGSGTTSGGSQSASSSGSGSSSSSSASSSSGSASSASSSGSAASVPSGVPSAPSGERYLQVGAYGSTASAKPQRDRLQGMGFTVQERSENGLVKLLIGPFGSARLQQVQSQLKSAGIDSFPR